LKDDFVHMPTVKKWLEAALHIPHIFTKLMKNKESESKFKEYIQNLIDYCNKNNVILL